jgi:hypothetical protein
MTYSETTEADELLAAICAVLRVALSTREKSDARAVIEQHLTDLRRHWQRVNAVGQPYPRS